MSNSELTVIRVCPVDDLPPGGAKRVDGPVPIAVFNSAGTYYATGDVCTHDNSSLTEEGFVEGDEVECGWHFARFCLRTGAVKSMPARKPLPVYEVTVEDGYVCVAVPTDGDR